MNLTFELPYAVRTLGMLLLLAACMACAGAPAGTPATSTSRPGATSSPDPAGGLCGVFSPVELAPFLGAPPGPGRDGGPLQSSCEWDAGDPFVMIQKVPVEYFEDYAGAQGYRELSDIGEQAFVAAHPFGRIASARTADAAYIVVAAEGTEENAHIDILRSFIERSPGAPVLEAPEQGGTTEPPAAGGPGAATNCGVDTAAVSQVTAIEMVQGDGCSWSAVDEGTLYEVHLGNVPLDFLEFVRGQQPLAGVGDEAYLDTGVVYARVGTRAFSVSVVTLSLDDQAQIDVAIAIARRVAEGLR
jgi:hypothetical protein